MSPVYKLVGYDRDDEHLVAEFDVPASVARRVLLIAGLDPDYSGPTGDFHLSENRAVRIADMIGRDIDPDHAEFFLETYAEENAHA